MWQQQRVNNGVLRHASSQPPFVCAPDQPETLAATARAPVGVSCKGPSQSLTPSVSVGWASVSCSRVPVTGLAPSSAAAGGDHVRPEAASAAAALSGSSCRLVSPCSAGCCASVSRAAAPDVEKRHALSGTSAHSVPHKV